MSKFEEARRNLAAAITKHDLDAIAKAFATDAEGKSIPVYLKQRCLAIKHSDNRVNSIVVQQNSSTDEHLVDSVVSSIPLSELPNRFKDLPPKKFLITYCA